MYVITVHLLLKCGSKAVEVVDSKSSGKSVPVRAGASVCLFPGGRLSVPYRPSALYSQNLRLGFSQVIEANIQLISSLLIFANNAPTS